MRSPSPEARALTLGANQFPPEFAVFMDHPTDPDGFGALEVLHGAHPDACITVIFSDTLQRPDYDPAHPSDGFDPEATEERAKFDLGRLISMASHAGLAIDPDHIQFYRGIPGTTQSTADEGMEPFVYDGQSLDVPGLKTQIPYNVQTDSRDTVVVSDDPKHLLVSNYDVHGDANVAVAQAGSVAQGFDRLRSGRGSLWVLGIGPLREAYAALQVDDIRRRVAGIAIQGTLQAQATSAPEASSTLYAGSRGYNINSCEDAADGILGMTEIPVGAVNSRVSRSYLLSWQDRAVTGVNEVDLMVESMGPGNLDLGYIKSYRVHRTAARRTLGAIREALGLAPIPMPPLGPHDTLAALVLLQMMGDPRLKNSSDRSLFGMRDVNLGVKAWRRQVTGLNAPTRAAMLWRNLVGPLHRRARGNRAR